MERPCKLKRWAMADDIAPLVPQNDPWILLHKVLVIN